MRRTDSGMTRYLIHTTVLLRAAVVLLALSNFGTVSARAAPEKTSGTVTAQTPEAKLQALSDLLADADIQALLHRRRSAVEEAAAPPAPQNTMAISLADRLQGLRAHLIALAGATGTLPAEATMARDMVAGALDERGWWTATAFFIGFVALGFGTEGLFRLVMRPAQLWLLALTLTSVNERVRAVFARLAFGIGLVVSFGLGSVGAFLLFDWPIVLKEILLGYLIAFLLVRLIAVLGRMLLAPGAARFRVVPITTPAAQFLYRRWLVLAVLIGVGWQTISLFSRFGLSPLAGEWAGDAIGLVMLAVGIDLLWRMPRASLGSVALDAPPPSPRHRTSFLAVGSVLLVVLWVLWLTGATQAFWLVAFAAGLPAAIVVARHAVNHILRPPGVEVSSLDAQTLDVIVFERGIRSIVIVSAALILGHILDIDFTRLAMTDTLTNRVLRGAISIVIIALMADFLWHFIKALIDRRIALSLGQHGAGVEDAGHAARLATLLPIVGNMIFVIIVIVAGMMILASVGVEIGPLVASAGVVGVAIGFGAQTLVKDIISGIFYLFDDAFRIGEYIQSGSYKGTVESFSLRSVKLRHQRGALYTVPFGILGAVQNQSRDWVVDKIVMNVPYGTDLDKVRKLIKKIGEALLDDPEFGADIIAPLKMQGVAQFGDFAIQIQTKMMTKPGDAQFLARRKALLLINTAFADNGIGFAVPMIHVSGQGGEAAAAAAQKGLELLRPSPSI